MGAPDISERDRRVLRSFARRIDASDPGAHNNLGVLYYRKGMIDEAIDAFSRALELDPKMQVAQQNLEIAYKQTGHYDRRVADLQERLRSSPDDRGARWELGRAYASLGQYDIAVQEFLALVTQNPNDLAALLQLGMAEKHRGDLEAASQWFERARDLDPDSSVVQFYLGEVLYNRGLNQDALVALQRSIDLNQENADAHYLIAFVHGDLGRHEEARQATKRAIQLNPTFARAQSNLALDRQAGERRATRPSMSGQVMEVTNGRTLAHLSLGVAFRQKGYYVDALREYRLALELGEDRRLVLQAMAEVHLLRRDHSAALELYDRLVEEIPDSPKLWNERGVVLHQLGRLVEALESYARALEAAPEYSIARNNLAVTLAHEGRHEEAVEAFHDAARAEESLAIPRLNLGLLLFRLRRFQLALQAYRQVLDRMPQSAPAWNGIGLVLTELGRSADARNAFARAVESDSDSAEAHYNLSFALSALGEYDAALRAVTRAQTLDPYYVPQKFRLTIDLQYEDPTITVVPEISADVHTEIASTKSLHFDEGMLAEIFRDLERPAARSSVQKINDPLALARDYLSKGLFELALAETNRAASRGSDETETVVLSGQIFTRRGLHGEALERFRAARVRAPDRIDARLGELRALLSLGRGRDAAADAEQLAREHPNDVEVLVTLAEARRTGGDPAGALEAARAARARAPQRPDVLKLEGDVAWGTGDLDAASEAYRAAQDLDPRFVEVRLALGRVQEARNDLTGAEGSYRAALELLPTYSEGAIALAALLRRTERAREAVLLLVDLLENHPTDPDALLALGQALIDDGCVEQSLQAFQRVISFDPEHIAANFFTGVALARLRRYREAASAWERVVRLDSGGPFAQRARRHARSALDLQHIFQTEAA